MQFIEYACGHSTPVRGAGGKTARACPDCERGYRALTGRKRITGLSVARMMGHAFSYDHVAHCEMCASSIP